MSSESDAGDADDVQEDDVATGETTVETVDHQPATDDETKELSWDEVKQRENAKRQATKFIKLEYPDGYVATFEYQLVEDLSEIARKHTTEKPTRSGSEPQVEMTDDQQWSFAAELFGEALVDAPEGFKATEREIREGLTKPVVDDMVDAISDFSKMDEETWVRFRGTGGR